jgi:hypothetical protein
MLLGMGYVSRYRQLTRMTDLFAARAEEKLPACRGDFRTSKDACFTPGRQISRYHEVRRKLPACHIRSQRWGGREIRLQKVVD